MISKSELLEWIESLPAGAGIGVDEGGLTLIALEPGSKIPLDWLEIGGCPEGTEEP